MSHGHPKKSHTPRFAPPVSAELWYAPNGKPCRDLDGTLARARYRRESQAIKRRIEDGVPLPWEEQPECTKLVQAQSTVSDAKSEEGSCYPSEKSHIAAAHPVRIKNLDDPAE